ncbi:histidine triad nucleotide-binding protein [bacterium]|nr:histidine triad nucleotide-binding protein [bacterium]
MPETVFGKILTGEIQADKVWEDDQCIAINDISPQAPTHVLIIPRAGIATLDDTSEEHTALLGHVTWVAVQIARKLGIDKQGYRLVWNCKESGGQEVFHIHLHLLGGRRMDWPPG